MYVHQLGYVGVPFWCASCQNYGSIVSACLLKFHKEKSGGR
jgi:hypothetical protein